MTALNEVLIYILPPLNLVLAVLLVAVFIRLFLRESHKKIYLLPWKLLFAAIIIFVFEEILTVLRLSGAFRYPYLAVNPFFEMVMVSLFIYMLLLQREHVIEEGYKK